jgi:hypothetical protein
MALADFVSAAEEIRLAIQVTTYALENLEAMRAHSPEHVMTFMAKYDILFAVWFDPARGIKARKVKGPEKSEPTHTINAFPVADESEAREWSARFAGGGAPVFEPLNAGPRLIARDGEILDD